MTLFDKVMPTLDTDLYQPICALPGCDLDSHGWSGVEDWKDWKDAQGRWIGWCGNDHRNAWIKGDRTQLAEVPTGSGPGAQALTNDGPDPVTYPASDDFGSEDTR